MPTSGHWYGFIHENKKVKDKRQKKNEQAFKRNRKKVR